MEVETCKTVKGAEPTAQKKRISNVSESVPKKRKRVIIHILARMTQDGERPRSSKQKVPFF